MREFKFRALVKKDYDYDFMEYDMKAFDDPFEAHKNGEIVLMQYTGFKDQNGIEIYEGDVLYFPYYETQTNNRIVKFENGQFVGELIRSGYSKSLKVITDEMEVIGNIYDNPHLLDQ